MQALPRSGDRIVLFNRIRFFLSDRRRRGRLRLPAYFPREVLRLRELTKRQLASTVYWVKPNTSVSQRLSKTLFDHIRRGFPGILWNSPRKVLEHMANAVGTLRLRKTDWPGISRYRWPSTPTFSEMLAMSRRGYSVHGLDRVRIVVKGHITYKQVQDDLRLATKIVSKNIIGIRSSCTVPAKFLRWFRYRNGFLILSVRYRLPSGLVRFLIAQWLRCPYSLWLKEPCPFKIFLNRHTPTDYVREVVVSPALPLQQSAEPQEESSLDMSFDDGSSSDSMLGEMAEEFPELFSR